MQIQNLVAIFLLFFQNSDAAKILLFFAGGTYSHKVSIWPFVTALAERHNVTFVSPFEKRPYDHPSVNDIAPKAMVDAMGRQFENVDRVAIRQRGDEKYLLINYHRDILRACEAIFGAIDKEPDLYRLFYGEKEDDFDLIINNAVFGDCGYVLAHRQMARGTKLIIYDSTSPMFWWADMFGFSSEAAWIPEANNIRDYPMDFYERFQNYFASIYWYWKKQYELFPALEEMMKKMYNLEKAPPLVEVERNASLILIATHYSMDYARSLPPFMVHVGGMQCWQNKEKPLEGEFKDFLDKATDGAILIAFGSTIDLSTIPEEFKQTFFQMMTKFPKLQFIWRWNGPLPENAPKNLKVANWLPQIEILGHPNLKAFISHAGLNSLTEATYQGKPIILLPLFADQDYNGYRVQAYEVGIRLEIRTLTASVMEDAVREILTNKKYTENMQKMSAIMRDRPMSPIDTAVFWTEFVLRHEDTSPLKPLNKLNSFQNRLLDVFLVISLIMSVFIFILGWGICWGIRKLKKLIVANVTSWTTLGDGKFQPKKKTKMSSGAQKAKYSKKHK